MSKFQATHPELLYRAMDKLFDGEDWLAWEPETVLLSLGEDIADEDKDKLLAVHAVASNSSMVLNNAQAFEKVVMAFCNNICIMDEYQEPYLEEIMYAVGQIRKIIRLAHPDDGKDAVFHGEVPGYVAAIARYRGWFMLPSRLSFAQKELDRLTGLQEGSKLRKEHAGIFEAVQKACRNLHTSDAEKLLESGEIKELEGEDTSKLITKQIIGALLYDPTLPYKQEKVAGAIRPVVPHNDGTMGAMLLAGAAGVIEEQNKSKRPPITGSYVATVSPSGRFPYA